MCFSCSPFESQYLDIKNKRINICQNFAMKIWNASNVEELNKKSTIFDNCGFYFENTPLEKYLEDNGYINPNSDHLNYILISNVFTTFEDFVNTIKIPYFSDYKIIIIENNQNCYNLNNKISINFLFLIIILFLNI